MTASIKVENLSFSYRRRRVLSGVSWTVGSGVTALLGPNGAGKTTLIRCMVGLATPASGTVSIDDVNLASGGEYLQKIGYVPQSPSLPPLCRVDDVVAYAAWLSGIEPSMHRAAVTRALEQMDLVDLGSRRIRTLSGGQKQRVALATGVVHDPHVLVLDEPTVGLDPGQRLKVREVIRRIGRDRPVVLSTHLTEDVEHLSDRVGVLVNGGIVFDGSTLELCESYRSRAAEGLESDQRLGSAFERAYDDLMVSLGAGE